MNQPHSKQISRKEAPFKVLRADQKLMKRPSLWRYFTFRAGKVATLATFMLQYAGNLPP